MQLLYVCHLVGCVIWTLVVLDLPGIFLFECCILNSVTGSVEGCLEGCSVDRGFNLLLQFCIPGANGLHYQVEFVIVPYVHP